jgi:hypothetical protein
VLVEFEMQMLCAEKPFSASIDGLAPAAEEDVCADGAGVEGAEGGGGSWGRAALSRLRVLMGNFVRQVEHTGTGWQKMDKQTEQTKPISMIFLWQKQAARKSTLSRVGRARMVRMAGGGRKAIWGW